VLKRYVAQNFRSLKDLTIELAPLTALVGANGSGKSSILRGIDLMCGQRWPSLNALRPSDFADGDPSVELLLRLRHEPPLIYEDKLSTSHQIHGFELTCRPYKRKTGKAQKGDPNFDFRPLDSAAEPPMVALSMGKGGPHHGPLTYVPGQLRDQAGVLFIDHRRSLGQHQPWARGSILARLLAPARRELDSVEFAEGKSHAAEFAERYQSAMDSLRTPRVQQIEDMIAETARRSLGFLGSEASKDLSVRFGFADPANPFGTLRLNYREGDLELPAEEVGSGIQSAIIVGIFEAYRQLETEVGTILIEEPEMYLHPQAQRYLYGLLCDLVDNDRAQVIYSTHSPVFADLERFESLRLVRREPGGTTTVSQIDDAADIEFLDMRRARRKLHTFDVSRSEILFARRVWLVEGKADQLAARAAIERIGVDPDAEDFAIVDCGSKSGIPFMARICRALGIPFVAMFDEDVREVDELAPNAEQNKDENKAAKALNAQIADAVGEAAKTFVLKPSIEEALAISRNAKDKPLRVAEALEATNYEDWPSKLVDAAQELVALDTPPANPLADAD
jgi:putative ATP-dependent endonuclease of OLD family